MDGEDLPAHGDFFRASKEVLQQRFEQEVRLGKSFLTFLTQRFSSMHQIDLNEAKWHLADFIDIALGGEEIVITQDDQPVLQLMRVAAPKVRRKAGSAKGLITMASDFDAALEDFRAYMQ